MILVCNNSDAVDELLDTLQWDSSATSIARMARMHAKRYFTSMVKLRENETYAQAIREVAAIGDPNGLLPF